MSATDGNDVDDGERGSIGDPPVDARVGRDGETGGATGEAASSEPEGRDAPPAIAGERPDDDGDDDAPSPPPSDGIGASSAAEGRAEIDDRGPAGDDAPPAAGDADDRADGEGPPPVRSGADREEVGEEEGEGEEEELVVPQNFERTRAEAVGDGDDVRVAEAAGGTGGDGDPGGGNPDGGDPDAAAVPGADPGDGAANRDHLEDRSAGEGRPPEEGSAPSGSGDATGGAVTDGPSAGPAPGEPKEPNEPNEPKEPNEPNATDDAIGDGSDGGGERDPTDTGGDGRDRTDPKDGTAAKDASAASAASADPVPAATDDTPEAKLVDYASKLAGAQVLESSHSLKGASNLLAADRDRYSIAPCSERRHVVVGLSEDILVKRIKLANYERYSSRVRGFEVLASQEYPVPDESYWNKIGSYEAQSRSGEQAFELEEPAWARYLKFRFLSHYGSEHYCTLSQIKVHGSTMLQGFHEQWNESEKNDKESEERDREAGGETEARQAGDAVVVREGGDGGQEQDQSREKVEETSHDLGEHEDTSKENAEADKSPNSTESTQVKESHDTSENHQEDEMENRSVPTQDGMDERMDAKTANESRQDAIADSTEKLGSDEEEANENDEKSDGSGSSDSSPETALEEDREAGIDLPIETEEILIEIDESNANDAALIKNSTPASRNHQESISDHVDEVAKDPDGRRSNKTDPEESVAKADEGREQPAQNIDSSISAAMTGVVKAAVADASGAIKNATSGAIKNVKDAMRTTVRPPAGGTADEADNKGVNATSDEGASDAAGRESESKKEQTPDSARQEDPSSKAVVRAHAAGPQSREEGGPPPAATPKDAVAPKAEGGSQRADGSNATAADHRPERAPPVPKEVPEAAGRDPPRREAVAAAGGDGGADAAAAEELFERLSRRFPRASCMEDLDPRTFRSSGPPVGAGGERGDRPGGGGGAAKAKMEPIFNKITNEIKSVQVAQHRHEQYASALKRCYEAVLRDVADDLDSLRAGVDRRLESLERAAFLSKLGTTGGGRPNPAGRVGATGPPAAFLPAAASAFRVAAASTLPEGSEVPCAVIGILVLLPVLLRCLPRLRKKQDRNIPPPPTANRSPNGAICNDPMTSSAPASSHLRHETNSSENDIRAIHISKLNLANESLEKENSKLSKELDGTRGRLVDAKEELIELQTRNAALQREHASLQQERASWQRRYSRPEHASADLFDGDRGEMGHGLLRGISADSAFSTPTPSIQSEPVPSEIGSAPPPNGPGPLTNRFRRKKSKQRAAKNRT